MFTRAITPFLKKIAPKYPVLSLVGPRQSGKSTLCRELFPDRPYVSMEDPDLRRLATEDPRGFFKHYPDSLVIDEVQRVPELLSYIQTRVDTATTPLHYVLTGSHQLLLMEKVTQSLAGRTVIAKLLPFSRRELWTQPHEMTIDELMLTGGYPRIYNKHLESRQWLQQYYETYVQRDVRQLLNVGDLDQFDRFIRLCAGRAGQPLSLSSLGNECGVSQPTAKSWLSILKTCFICFTLQPHHRNFNKRITKTPKLYFYDTGLLCYLLNIQNAQMLATHPLRGNIFENWVVTEYVKSFTNQGIEPPLYFWQAAGGHEVDLVIDQGDYLYPVEIKSSYTFNSGMVKNMDYFASLQKPPIPKGSCVYCGDSATTFKDFEVTPWSTV